MVELAAYIEGALFLYQSHSRAIKPAHVDALPPVKKVKTLRLILMGDTGLPGKQRDAVRKQVLAERKDAVIALGDLVYPYPPPCETGAINPQDLPFYEQRVAHSSEGLRSTGLCCLGESRISPRQALLVELSFPYGPFDLGPG